MALAIVFIVMEEPDPPEIPRMPSVCESFGPMSDQSLVKVAKFSPLWGIIAIGYENGLIEVDIFQPQNGYINNINGLVLDI